MEELFEAYKCMVKECLDKAVKANITSRKRLHEIAYRELRAKFPHYPSHYIYTAITQALAISKSYRRLSTTTKMKEKKKMKEKDIIPSIEDLNAVLLDDTHLFWFSWGSLKLATQRGHITIPFKVHEHSKKFVNWQVKDLCGKMMGSFYT